MKNATSPLFCSPFQSPSIKEPNSGLYHISFLHNSLNKILDLCGEMDSTISCIFVDIYDTLQPAKPSIQIDKAMFEKVAQLVVNTIRVGDPAVHYDHNRILIFVIGADEQEAFRMICLLRKKLQKQAWTSLMLRCP